MTWKVLRHGSSCVIWSIRLVCTLMRSMTLSFWPRSPKIKPLRQHVGVLIRGRRGTWTRDRTT